MSPQQNSEPKTLSRTKAQLQLPRPDVRIGTCRADKLVGALWFRATFRVMI